MTAVYTWDVFATLDGYGSFGEDADWGGYWGKHGPELLDHRAEQFGTEQRMVYGATTFREVASIMVDGGDPGNDDEWNVRLMRLPGSRRSRTCRLSRNTINNQHHGYGGTRPAGGRRGARSLRTQGFCPRG
jgi:hypothetical protein